MLVLSRKASEKIVLAVGEHTIEVYVTDIRGDKARIGIEASAEVKILRGEVIERETKLVAHEGHSVQERASERREKLEVAHV